MNENKIKIYETNYRLGCFLILFFVGLISFTHLITYLTEVNTNLEYLGAVLLIIILSGAFATFGYILGLIFDINEKIRNKENKNE